MADSGTNIPTTISVRSPSKYVARPADPHASVPPPLEWLYRTWSVTHSTLSMWRSAKNVRITYKPYEADKSSSPAIDDLVEYEKKGSQSGVKTVEGVDRPDPGSPSAWDWRGKGWLRIASSHWEVLGYGERPLTTAEGGAGIERWVVTWFAPTLFTQEGLDIYSDRREGLSRETLEAIMEALKNLDEAPKIVTLVEKQMQPVEISLPWQEKK
ncbi:hypothetical protein DL764_008595 [Monosporascus ibericus]|uniref:Uncharacterized protein n=1 Tax=Monosporascus ibericus TaxID=155417 RepID=A0A4Q4SZB4_9PEZI|nr:hypothetical protein DL764_008595 [Monosporascus ibericus]